MNQTFLTKKKLFELKEEIKYLINEIKICNNKIGETVSLDNDLRENPEFMSLRNKAEYELPNKIKEITDVINNYILIEDLEHIKNNDTEYIDIGHKVTLSDNFGNETKLTILGYDEGNKELGIISYFAPIAQELIDLQVGNNIILSFYGKRILYTIKSIEISELLDV